ncbi:DNA-3-methyladenine glycosylase 2 family protein [Candidatus Poribacteria bacterium]|nr:DNA-3-methyladenine glycosylase 2 family protein [Candidatus Poribacteria bacterium]MBT5534832.1 DNA-3-methyladenine glycosylase 2 family protein [Candidatus Poribacteria bacterium]MBT5712867.1 DNA-3-methyladenine glycosylase 2 family protein [Candidatus Poribacteria bacterium]MBT7097188.1 DNA-3-methyladenine glycosylase 2 family protein [Candidatus Poribacteria bacterium]MBT7806620.1 DNA-3-methyladenine glycosylase 2 family protein [Candidatus Poribacteria bacterium]
MRHDDTDTSGGEQDVAGPGEQEETRAVRVPYIGQMDLDALLTMGQTFAWTRQEDGYHGSIRGTCLRVTLDGSSIVGAGPGDAADMEAIVREYFDADFDLPALQARLSADEHVAAAVARHPGLRVLHQPLWECLASFILSTVNNIPRIQRIVNRLSDEFGERSRLPGGRPAFPTAEVIAEAPIDALYECGTGFRARGLSEAARAMATGDLDEAGLRSAPLDEARARLVGLYGVGDKVAGCILLYGLGRFEAFPVDVWIKREMERLYFDAREVAPAVIRDFAQERFGEWAGYAQVYLFHGARKG